MQAKNRSFCNKNGSWFYRSENRNRTIVNSRNRNRTLALGNQIKKYGSGSEIGTEAHLWYLPSLVHYFVLDISVCSGSVQHDNAVQSVVHATDHTTTSTN